jgi:uncharacterized membrane protein
VDGKKMNIEYYIEQMNKERSIFMLAVDIALHGNGVYEAARFLEKHSISHLADELFNAVDALCEHKQSKYL